MKSGLWVTQVIGTDGNRSVAYDFLLTFHSNHGPMYRFRDKRRFQSKITKFSHPRVLCAPAEGFPSELGIVAGVKNRMMWLPGRERSLTISSAVWIQYTTVTNGRTDRQTLGDRIASRRVVKI